MLLMKDKKANDEGNVFAETLDENNATADEESYKCAHRSEGKDAM